MNLLVRITIARLGFRISCGIGSNQNRTNIQIFRFFVEVLYINSIILSLLRILCGKNIFSVFEFERKYHVSNKQNNINTLAKANNIILKYDISLHTAFFQAALQLSNLIFPSISLLFVNIKCMPDQSAHNIG